MAGSMIKKSAALKAKNKGLQTASKKLTSKIRKTQGK